MALPVLLILPLFGATFTNLKVLIPAIVPFGWDPTFSEWDRLLHGGYHPWQILQPLLGYPYVTSLFNAVYHFWFFLAYGVICWQIASTDRPRLRMQYLLTFVLVWAVIGNDRGDAAVVGRSGLFRPRHRVAGSLRAAHELSAPRQHRRAGAGAGRAGHAVEALPIPGPRRRRRHLGDAEPACGHRILVRAARRAPSTDDWPLACAVFTALILIGSVHLGWHYAIDGYVSISATWFIWRGVGWLLDRRAVARCCGANRPRRSAAVAATRSAHLLRIKPPLLVIFSR